MWFTGRARFRGNSRLGKINLAVIGVAGALSELLLESPDADADAYFDYADWYHLSEPDLKLMKPLHPSYHRRAVEKSLKLLKTYWPAVENAAFHLQHDKDGTIDVGPHSLKYMNKQRAFSLDKNGYWATARA